MVDECAHHTLTLVASQESERRMWSFFICVYVWLYLHIYNGVVLIVKFFFVFLPLSLSTYSARDGKRIEKRQKNK